MSVQSAQFVRGALGWTKGADFILTDICQREMLLKQLEQIQLPRGKDEAV